MSVITKPHAYQKEGVRDMHVKFGGNALIADDMGLGKSFESLYYAWKYLPDDPPGPIVVVCPSHLKLNWRREAAKHLGIRAGVLYGRIIDPERPPPWNPNQVLVINYDILTLQKADYKKGYGPQHSWLQYLSDLNPRLMIVDEAQYIKERGSLRTKAVKQLFKRSAHNLFLSGTPLTKSPLDLFPVINMLRPDVFPSYFEYALEYTNARHRPWGWEYKGGRNLDHLNELLLETCMIRRTKADVLNELPKITWSVIPLEVDLTEYNRAEADFIAWLEAQDAGKAARARSAEEMNKVGYLKRLASKLKIKQVINWTADFLESGRKLLMGAIHYDITDEFTKVFRDRMVLVDGRISPEEKDRLTQKFNINPSTDLCVGNLNAAGTGWSCRATSDVAACELPWTPGELSQFVNRVHGLERGLPGVAANVYLLVAEGTIDEDLCKILQARQAILDQTLDGGTVDEGFDIYAQVKARIKDRQKAARGGGVDRA